eukprot:g5730.t1
MPYLQLDGPRGIGAGGVLGHQDIGGILTFGDSRQRGFYIELLEFMQKHDQNYRPGGPPIPVGGGSSSPEAAKFDTVPNDVLHEVDVSWRRQPDYSNAAAVAAAAARRSPRSPPSPLRLRFVRTWGEFEDEELRPCFKHDDLPGLKGYLGMRHERGGLQGLRDMARALEQDGDDMDVVAWTAGIHNARCSISNRLYETLVRAEADLLRAWARRGLERLGRSRFVVYREPAGVIMTVDFSPCAWTIQRVRSLNSIAERVVKELDADLQRMAAAAAAAAVEGSPSRRRVMIARAVYLPGITSMTSSRPDRTFDINSHFYPMVGYPHSPADFPRIASSEMILMFLTQLSHIMADGADNVNDVNNVNHVNVNNDDAEINHL